MTNRPTEIFEVRIREYKGIEFCAVGTEPLVPGDVVVVDRNGELECGDVITEPYSMSELEQFDGEVLAMVRKANESDISRWEQNQALEKKAFISARCKIRDRELSMKLVRVESTLDRKKLRFYFTAENRVDFRELVKDLAYIFKTRIEMRQIGVRDEARMIGGYSHCGQEFCCVRHLNDFSPVTIRMAKDQDLALNPTKISGACGRLMCCLAYEYDYYKESKKRFPKVGTRLIYQGKDAVVTACDVLRSTVKLLVKDVPTEISIQEYEEAKKGETKPPEPEEQLDTQTDDDQEV